MSEGPLIIKPQEYCYLESPWSSNPALMIMYTLKGLCVSGVIQTSMQLITVGRHAKYKRRRLFLGLAKNASERTDYARAERFVLSLFTRPLMSVPSLRGNILVELHDKVSRFKTQYVYEDVKDKGLCGLRYFLTVHGRGQRNKCAQLIDHMDGHVDSLLQQRPLLNEHLHSLGTNIVFLEEATLNKLKKHIPDLNELLGLSVLNESGVDDFSYISLDNFGSYDSGSDDFGDFDFGGGEGGGGGAGDLW